MFAKDLPKFGQFFHGRIVRARIDRGRIVRSQISPPLCKLINRSFYAGKFPDLLRVSTPVFKKGDRENPRNFRPISSLSRISKTF